MKEREGRRGRKRGGEGGRKEEKVSVRGRDRREDGRERERRRGERTL